MNHQPVLIDHIDFERNRKWDEESEAVYQELKKLAESQPEPYRHPFLNTDSQD